MTRVAADALTDGALAVARRQVASNHSDLLGDDYDLGALEQVLPHTVSNGVEKDRWHTQGADAPMQQSTRRPGLPAQAPH